MLRRIANPRANICLRCSLRLFSHSARLRSRPTARHFSSRDLPTNDPWSNGEFEDDSRSDPFPRSARVDSDIQEFRPRRRRAGNRLLTEDSESLGRAMLGRPARAIVLRDGGLYVKPQKREQYDPDPVPENPDLEALLESQQSDASVEDVRDNISSLRPTSESLLSERDFRKLQETLLAGFTAPQLQGYLIWHGRPAPANNTTEGMAMRLPWVKSITTWTPLAEVSTTTNTGDRHLQGYVPLSAKPKERLAIRILRECWGLSIRELTSGFGEVRLKMRAAEFVLLMRGTQRFMNNLGKMWLEPGEKIEAIRTQNTLRFVIKKPKADILLAELDKTLNLIVTKSVPLELVTTGPLEESVIEELGRITNTHIRRSVNGKRLQITWLQVRNPTAPSTLEDLRHVVFRLLLTALVPPRATTSLTSDLPSDSHGRFVTDSVNKAKWGWLDRMSQWERFVLPCPSDAETVRPDAASSMSQGELVHELPLPVEIKHSTFEQEVSSFTWPEDQAESRTNATFPPHPVKWGESLKSSTKVHYGHVLHAEQAREEPAEPESPTVAELIASGRNRIFSHLIPHPTRLAEIEASAHDTEQTRTDFYPTHNTLVIRFQPSPSLGPDGEDAVEQENEVEAAGSSPAPVKKAVKLHKISVGKKATKGSQPATKLQWPRLAMPPAPMLELRISINDTEVLGIQSLRAIKNQAISDVMLPGSLIDMRFTQTQYAELLGSAEAVATWQPIADFIGNSRIALYNGKVDVPEKQRFPIPRWLFSEEAADEQEGGAGNQGTKKKRGRPVKSKDPNELISTSYVFVGLELHRAVSMPYEGFKMTYTSIEAGQGGGRRAELSIDAIKLVESSEDGSPASSSSSSSSSAPETSLTDKDFLRTCYNLARDDAMWAGYPGDPMQE